MKSESSSAAPDSVQTSKSLAVLVVVVVVVAATRPLPSHLDEPTSARSTRRQTRARIWLAQETCARFSARLILAQGPRHLLAAAANSST